MSQISSRTTAQPGSHPTAESSTSFLPFGPPDLEHSLVRRFEQQAARHPGRLAARVGDASIAYVELERAANRVAHAVLDAAGDGDEPVALLFGPGLDALPLSAVGKVDRTSLPEPGRGRPLLEVVSCGSGRRMPAGGRGSQHPDGDLERVLDQFEAR